MKSAGIRKSQRGSVLLEALFAILIFSVGFLALIALQAMSIKNSIDSKYRSDASYLANQIVAQMWLDRANADRYTHYPSGSVCSFSGAPSSNAAAWVTPVSAWVSQVTALLPGSAPDKTQIVVATIGATKQVTVTVCWKGPLEPAAHNFALTAQLSPP